MRVLYDNQAYDLQTHGGVSHCMVELYKNLPTDVHAKLGVYESDNVYLQELGYKGMGITYRQFLCGATFKGKRRIFTPYFKMRNGFDYWGDQNYSIKLLKEGKYDVFHPTFFDDYFLPYLNGKPFVLTIHDMIPELYPQYFGKDDFQVQKKQILAPLAAHIVVPSQQTKNDVVRLLDIPEEKISVIYHGGEAYQPKDWNQELSVVNFPYILYVGSRDKYKNFEYFIQSCVPIIKSNPVLKIVCTGCAFDRQEKEMLEANGVTDRCVNRFVRTEDEMANLYHYAKVFVFPSEYEGFGLPILECYKADGLLLLNETSCFPEIAGDAALYFNKDEKGRQLTDMLEYAIFMSEEKRNALLRQQRERLGLYSWEKASRQLADVYRMVVERK